MAQAIRLGRRASARLSKPHEDVAKPYDLDTTFPLGIHVNVIVDRIAHNPTRVEMGDENTGQAIASQNRSIRRAGATIIPTVPAQAE